MSSVRSDEQTKVLVLSTRKRRMQKEKPNTRKIESMLIDKFGSFGIGGLD